ncbi:T9SS type A sorting domain-containing protein [Maribellus comscasis]|uniref:T9SS type A sorting domain-containing protein n=1 Tax=Maribellus comscasis TaxID=2681766 RepID=A0A6I6JN22_9BACT|nr:T9SS type A sorting domain-containing protein [Maribellus comscasis]QGY44356.1 T9SS type A sorting domain-containing protein [Maribellus comscasis]
MKKILLIDLILLIGVINISAQKDWKKNKVKVLPPVCYASGKIEKAAIPPSNELLNNLKSGEKKSEIIVNYRLFPQNAKDAFEYAVSLWEGIIESPVPIYIQATWSSLGSNVLGSCGPSEYYQNFENTPHQDRFYPVAIAEKITKTEITGSEDPDMIAQFNQSIDWYFGTDLNTPDSLYDFVTVVMHELAHGLGFTGFFFVSGNEGAYGYSDFGDAAAFDLLVIKNTGEQLTDTYYYPNQSSKLKDALTSSSLYANSPVAIADGNGLYPRLYAPSEWDEGSSVYHLNDAHYPSNNPNSLMTHAIGKAEAIHDPGPLTKGIMADIGWKHMYLDFEPLKDIEEAKPLIFNVTIESDYEIDTASLMVIYSTDSFQSQIDSASLVRTETTGLFSAEIVPENQTDVIQYYINAGDIKNRTFRLPTEAPKVFYEIKIGPDTESPVIEHEPIAYYLPGDEKLEITAEVNDNIGIDTVYVGYDINGINQESFGLERKSETTFSGYFNFDNNLLNDGDIVHYQIFAEDSSGAKNIAVLPEDSVFSFQVEEIYDPVANYVNNFDNPTTDFIISDFEIYTEDGFENGALHSPHPYPSPNDNNEELNFSTILKHPIIIRENGSMTFDEIVLVEPGENNTNFGDSEFWDYVVVEGSKDLGKTWLPVADGYDSGKSTIWLTTYNEDVTDQISNAVGEPDLYISNGIDLLENGNFSVGDTILIRFRLYSDPFAHGWGWAIDNLRIQQPVSSPATELSPGNVSIFPNPAENQVNLTFEISNDKIKDIQIVFYNTFGQNVKSIQFENVYGTTTKTIDISGFTKGMYLVNILENGQKVTSRKLIKK